MKDDNLWVWIRIPLSVLERAITALKDRVGIHHFLKKREEAQSDDDAAESIKKALRETHDHGRDDSTQF
jgi:hypothetical protein